MTRLVTEEREERNDERTAYHWRRLPDRLRTLVLLLFFLVSLSSWALGYIVGRLGNYEHYTGQIIDTITIGSAERPLLPPDAKVYQINVRGVVSYTDGTPYRNGEVELRSQPRYTITDDYGRFEFLDVPTGKHTVSVLRDGIAVAGADFVLERETNLTVIHSVRLEDGTCYITVPVELPEIELVLEVDRREYSGGRTEHTLEIVLDGERRPGREDPPPPEPPVTPPADQEPSQPGEPLDPSEPPLAPPDSPIPPVVPPPIPPAKPADPDPTPPLPSKTGLTVAGSAKGSPAWSTKTAIDLFAERPGNSGVKTIRGQNVIAPGSHGSYVFRVHNQGNEPLAYTIGLSETDENNPPLPMKYRLKAGTGGSAYIGTNAWKKADSIKLGETVISGGSVAYYTLEWKWESSDDDTDTKIGSQKGTPLYVLDIIINAWA